jgi:hypothetical protein
VNSCSGCFNIPELPLLLLNKGEEDADVLDVLVVSSVIPQDLLPRGTTVKDDTCTATSLTSISGSTRTRRRDGGLRFIMG